MNERGERQPGEVGAHLTAVRFDRAPPSSLQRTRRTAELAMPHTRIEFDDDLMVWDYGAYEGKRTANIEVKRPGWRLFRDGCPSSETLDAHRRVPTVSSATLIWWWTIVSFKR